MSEPFLGEVKVISWTYPPKGWAFCSGQLLPINQNQALFAILGTTYGGNGQTNFALPDLRGRIPVHWGAGFELGQSGGQAAHTVSQSEMPAHNHAVVADSTAPPAGSGGNQPDANKRLAQSVGDNLYRGFTSPTPMDASSIGSVGGSQAHENRAPYLALNFVIALQGIFPSRN